MRCSGVPMKVSMGIVARSSGLATMSMSGWLSAAAWMHELQRPQAVKSPPGDSHVSTRASRLAKVALPTPSSPMKR